MIAILGPTGVGKSKLALTLAEGLNAEIVSADSRQVYRWLSIGTAKPTPADLARVPHHLVDYVEPDQPYSVATYVDDATTAISEVHGRGRPVLLVGGTYHYVQAVLDGLDLARVPPQPEFRATLEADAARAGPAALHARLAVVDRVAAEQIPSSNVRRVIRALEVVRATGQPFSRVGRRRGEPREALRLATTMPRDALYARIDARVDAMLAAGWLAEIRNLLDRGYDPTLPALTSTGYRELIRHLRGELPLDEAVRRVKYSTHAYVRRQYVWLRRDARLAWLEQGTDLPARTREIIDAWLAQRSSHVV
ncbi:MAG: tRNA (adenosine(37)-N6)-dimethylallyltransferase MiaA [Chloroflexi bacterium]|nr:tRNA (adenosine(37)-N6)-dimethylallyltransferase MiaA [Chloroflexota bacterium]